MSHTASRYQQDLAFPDGVIFLGVNDIFPNVLANATATRNAAGDYSINQGSSLTVIYGANLAGALLRRFGFGEDIQSQFGGSGISGSAQEQFYRPGLPEALNNTGQQLVPRSALKTKGFKLLSLDVIYQIGTANLTSQSLRVDSTKFVNATALATTNLLAAATNGLSSTFAATPYVTTVPILTANQVYIIGTDTECWIELTVVTPATSTYRLYGFDCNVAFNYN